MMRKSPTNTDRSRFKPACVPFAAAVFACLLATGCQSLRPADPLTEPFQPQDHPVDLLGDINTTLPTSETKSLKPPAPTDAGNGVQQVGALGDRASGVVTAGAIQERNLQGAQPSGVVQADGDAVEYLDVPAGNPNRLVGFLTSPFGKDTNGAKQLYQTGDKVFRQAKSNPKQATDQYAAAAGYFRKAGDSDPGSALQQDALFMQAESHFFANELTEATETYQKLQKDFPRNRHNDKVASRLFTISKYWIDASKAGGDSWYRFNLFDSKLPSYDARGNAIRVLDQIRYDDPTGRLADDATMAAAAEYVRNGEFEKADEFLTDLRTAFTDSEHLFIAHLLGIRCKLQIYAGPEYSGLVLEEADTLIRQTRERFPDRLRNQKYSEMIARASQEVNFHEAERLANRARYREKQGAYGAANAYYTKILREFPKTPQAKTARTRLPETRKMPAKPAQRFGWLTTVFPDSKKKAPLELVTGAAAAPKPKKPDNDTLLR